MICYLGRAARYIGVVAEGQEAIDRLLLALLIRSPATSVIADGKASCVIVRTPHTLIRSELIATMLRMNHGADQIKDKLFTPCISRAANGNLLPQMYRQPLESLLSTPDALDLSMAEAGVTITFKDTSPPQRALLLSEIYRCTRPDDAPELRWSRREHRRNLIASYP